MTIDANGCSRNDSPNMNGEFGASNLHTIPQTIHKTIWAIQSELLRGDYIEDYIGDHYRGYKGVY